MDKDAAQAIFATALAAASPGFESFFLARLLQLEFSYDAARCTLRFPVSDMLRNPRGTLHGGVIATVLDISMGHLLNHLGIVGASTVDMNVRYLRAIAGGTCRCEAELVKRGRTIAFLSAQLFDGTEQLCAAASSTWLLPR